VTERSETRPATEVPLATAAAPADGSPEPPVAEPPVVPGATPLRGRLRRWGWVIAGLAIVALVVVVLAPLASPDPDGLESVAKQQGFIDAAQTTGGFLAGYEVPGLGGSLGTIVAGLLGVGVVFLAMLALGRLLRRRDASRR